MFNSKTGNPFKSAHTLAERQKSSARALKRYTNRCPVIVIDHSSSPAVSNEITRKYLVPTDMSIAQLVTVIKKNCHISSETAIYLITEGGSMVSGSSTVGQAYHAHKDKEDNFIYLCMHTENAFGCNF
tara:strand:- start:455 stop:838 length:384 start_codon:yes stop_codon:yes gene_type:complete